MMNLPEDAVAVSMRSLPLKEGSPYGSPCLPVEMCIRDRYCPMLDRFINIVAHVLCSWVVR